MSETACPQCGARYASKDDSCTVRWHELLALDHSRQVPWGPLHGLAFATFTLQHPQGATPQTLGRCLDTIRRVVIHGEPPAKVFADLRSRRDQVAYQPLRSQLAPRAFTVTIADLGEFTAETYETRLRGWARAALEAWSGEAAG